MRARGTKVFPTQRCSHLREIKVLALHYETLIHIIGSSNMQDLLLGLFYIEGLRAQKVAGFESIDLQNNHITTWPLSKLSCSQGSVSGSVWCSRLGVYACDLLVAGSNSYRHLVYFTGGLVSKALNHKLLQGLSDSTFSTKNIDQCCFGSNLNSHFGWENACYVLFYMESHRCR